MRTNRVHGLSQEPSWLCLVYCCWLACAGGVAAAAVWLECADTEGV